MSAQIGLVHVAYVAAQISAAARRYPLVTSADLHLAAALTTSGGGTRATPLAPPPHPPLPSALETRWIVLGGVRVRTEGNVPAPSPDVPFAFTPPASKEQIEWMELLLCVSRRPGDMTPASVLKDINQVFRHDAAIAELVPYLAQYARSTCVRGYGFRARDLLRDVELARAWIGNPYVSLEGHLSALLPLFCTLVVQCRVDSAGAPLEEPEEETDAAIRSAAMDVLMSMARSRHVVRTELAEVFRIAVPSFREEWLRFSTDEECAIEFAMGIMYLSNLTHTAFEFRLEKEKAVLQKGVDMYDSMNNKDPAALASFEDYMLAHCSQYVHGRKPVQEKVDHLVPPEGTACLTCVPHALVYMSNIDQHTIKEWRLHAFNEVFCLVFRGKLSHHEHDAVAILDGWDGSTCVVPVLRRFGERRRRYAVSKTNRFLAKDNFLQYCNLNPLVEIIEVDDLLDQGAKNTPNRKQTKRVWAMRCAQRAKALLALRPAQLLYIDLQRDILFTAENAAVVEASVQYCATCERVRCLDEMMMCGGGCADPPRYCDEQCQRKGWKLHKKDCNVKTDDVTTPQ